MTKKEQLKRVLNERRYITVAQVAEYLDVSQHVARQYLYEFTASQQLFDAGYKVYSTIKPVFVLQHHSRVENIRKMVTRAFPEIEFTIWNTQQLQPLYLHAQHNHHTFIDVEKIGLHPFYERVKAEYRSTHFPGEHFEVYDNPVVIRPLLSRAPKGSEQKLLAKILVDMSLDLDEYTYLGRSEYWAVWRGLLAEYRVPFGWMIGYSKRRNRFEQLFRGLLDHGRTKDEAFIHHLLREEN